MTTVRMRVTEVASSEITEASGPVERISAGLRKQDAGQVMTRVHFAAGEGDPWSAPGMLWLTFDGDSGRVFRVGDQVDVTVAVVDGGTG